MNKEFENKVVSNGNAIKEHMFIGTPNLNPDQLRNSVFDFRRNKRIDIKWSELFEQTDPDENEKPLDYDFNSIALFEKYFNQGFSEVFMDSKLADSKNYFEFTTIKVLTGYETDSDRTLVYANPWLNIPSKTFTVFENIFCLKHRSGRLYSFFDKEGVPLSVEELGVGTIIMQTSEPPIIKLHIYEDLTIRKFWTKIIKSKPIKANSVKYVIEKKHNLDPRLVYDKTGGILPVLVPVRKKTPEEIAKLSKEEVKLLNDILFEENSFQETNTIRKDLNYYREEFCRLDSQKVFLDKVIELINSSEESESLSLKNFLESNMELFWGNRDFLNSISDTYTTILTKKTIIEEKIDKLADFVKGYGYYLAKKDESFTVPGINKGVSIKKGYIYRKQATQGTYTQSLPGGSFDFRDLFPLIGFPFNKKNPATTTAKTLGFGLGNIVGNVITGGASAIVGGIVSNAITGLLGSNSAPGYHRINVPYEDYIEVSFNNDPIQEEINRLKGLGKEIHLIHKRDDEFYDNNGIPLSLIMKYCEDDDAFRRKCVIVVPFYEQILSGYNYELGANFYSNPLSGIIPTMLPEISFLEDLTYKLDWFGTEIGELVDSINLAPGEARNISLSAKFTETKTSSDSYKSISDLNITTTNDLSTEFQNEISRNVVKNESFGGKAGFEMDGFSAEANGSSNTTITDFSRQFSKVAKKASENISKRLTTEINSSKTSTFQIDESSSRTSTISNINQGRTLNLFIYKLYNKYYSGIYLNKLQVSLTSSVELVYGSGLYNRSDYNLSEGELSIFFQQLKNYLYFFPESVSKHIEEKISKFLRGELEGYTESDVNKERISDEAITYPISIRGNQSFEDEDATEKEKLVEMIDNISYGGKNLRREELILPSGGYYIDSMVGLNPATEEYSEKMRDLEKLKKTEEVEKIANENELIKTKIKLLENGITFIDKISNIQPESTTASQNLGVTLVHFSKSVLPPKKFFSSFSKDFDKDWKIFMDDQYIPKIKVKTSKDGYFARIFWQGTIPEISELKLSLIMINKHLNLKFITDEQ
jgi:hypothetical protein